MFHDDKMNVPVNIGQWIWQEQHNGCFWLNKKDFTLQQTGLLP